LPESLVGKKVEYHEYDHEGPQQGAEVVVKRDGYYRLLTGSGAQYAFAILLVILRLRYWPELEFGDDYLICEEMKQKIGRWGLVNRMQDEALGFRECYELYFSTYREHCPPPSPIPYGTKKLPVIKPITPDQEKVPLDSLEWSIRTANCFRRAGIKTLGDLVKHSPRELLKLKNLGRKSVLEIKGTLRDIGLALQDDEPS